MLDLTKLSPDRKRQYEQWPRDKRRANQQCFLPAAHNIRLCYLVMNKCGTTTAIKYIRDFHKLQTMGVDEYREKYSDHKVVTMWRDPWRRMESTYRWGRRVENPVPEFFPSTEQPFAAWVQEVCAQPVDSWFDMHLASQTYLDSSPLGRPADIRIPWDWPRLWRMFKVSRPGEILNASDPGIGVEWNVDAENAFERHYARDIAIWKELNHGT